jgi:peroxiredoxin (alkyl hydroperoxide reductase subunit C)
VLTVGDRFPTFELTGVVSSDPATAFRTITNQDYDGRWTVVFAWPKDFTFVCPTEIGAFGELAPSFEAGGASVLGVSTDNEYVHLAWRQQHPLLAELPFPMLADIRRDLCHRLGILSHSEGVALRATFVVDPEGTIRHVSVNDLDVGRDPRETLRVLEALQTGELTPCAWRPGQPTLTPA